MFENLLGQEALSSELGRLVLNAQLPAAILLHGPRYSGKLTAALELARAINCRTKGAPWSCPCPSCRRQRYLHDPYTICLGPRYFMEEIRVSSQTYLSQESEATGFLFYRSLRKLLNRFDPVLWDEDDSKFSKALGIIEAIDEDLKLIEPGRSSGEGSGLAGRKAIVGRLCASAEKLLAFLPSEGYTVQMVRRLSTWSHIKSGEDSKILIFEEADRMNDSVRNSLLKILEEPPSNTYFILLTCRLAGIIPTLRSRLRVFHLPKRSAEVEEEVRKRIFRLGQTSDSQESSGSMQAPIEKLFMELGDPFHKELEAWSRSFGEALMGSGGAFPAVREVSENIEALSPAQRRRALIHLLEQVEIRLSRASSWSVQASGLLREIQAQKLRFSHYNIPAATVLEQIYLRRAELLGLSG